MARKPITEADFVGLDRPNILCEGIATVTLTNGRHFTYRIEIPKAGNLKDKRILGLLSGSDNTSDYTSFAFVEDDGTVYVWKRYQTEKYLKHAQLVAGGAQEHVVQWQQAARCQRCGRLLTRPDSIALGLGPECAGKV